MKGNIMINFDKVFSTSCIYRCGAQGIESNIYICKKDPCSHQSCQSPQHVALVSLSLGHHKALVAGKDVTEQAQPQAFCPQALLTQNPSSINNRNHVTYIKIHKINTINTINKCSKNYF
jgi:hypothetical protein